MSKLPSGKFGKEANMYLINTLIKDAKYRELQGDKIKELRKSGKPYNFSQFQEEVDNYADEQIKPFDEQIQKEQQKEAVSQQFEGLRPKKGNVFAVDKDGNTGEIPSKNAKKFEAAGGTVVYGRK